MTENQTGTDQPSFYAVIPANVRYDNKLKANEKLLYGEITVLTKKDGKCWAGNKYFSDLYGVSKETASRWISNLVERGYVKITIQRNPETKQVTNRFIALTTPPIDEKVNTLLTKKSIPIDEKVKENNTSNNNTSNNINSITREEGKQISHTTSVVATIQKGDKEISAEMTKKVKAVIDYLNTKTGASFKWNAEKNKKHVIARIKEGYTGVDFQLAIDTKVKDWKYDERMRKFLRPETLFGTKFEGYVNEGRINTPIDFSKMTQEEAKNYLREATPEQHRALRINNPELYYLTTLKE